MSEPSRRSWVAKYATVFVVIVVGVFIAVAAESWWSERRDRAFELQLRYDMIEEFRANIDILQSDLGTNAEVSQRFAQLTELDDAELLALEDAFFNEAYSGFPDWAGFDREMGIIQALVTSGNTGAMSDRDLRLRLSRWAGLLTEKRRKTQQAVDYQMLLLMPTAVDAAADRTWAIEERRRIRAHYRSLAFLQGMVIENQELLLAEAEATLAYLKSLE